MTILLFTGILLSVITNLAFPNTVYALGPDIIGEDLTSLYTPTQYYWLFYQQEYDPYAINQININLYNDYSYRAEPVNYPYDNEIMGNNLSKTTSYKSRIVWYTWKKYTGEFESFEKFKLSIENSFSLREQFKKDFSKAFSINNK